MPQMQPSVAPRSTRCKCLTCRSPQQKPPCNFLRRHREDSPPFIHIHFPITAERLTRRCTTKTVLQILLPLPQIQSSAHHTPSTANVSPAAGITRITSQFSSLSQRKKTFLFLYPHPFPRHSETYPPRHAQLKPPRSFLRRRSTRAPFFSHSKVLPSLPHNFLHSRCVKNSSFFIASIRQPQRNVLPAAAQRKLTCNFAAATARTAPPLSTSIPQPQRNIRRRATETAVQILLPPPQIQSSAHHAPSAANASPSAHETKIAVQFLRRHREEQSASFPSAKRLPLPHPNKTFAPFTPPHKSFAAMAARKKSFVFPVPLQTSFFLL